jgi:hypothetical protein
MDSPENELPTTPGATSSRDAGISSVSESYLKSDAADTPPTEDQALALLQRQDLPAESIDQLTRNSGIMKSRKVRIAIASHPRAPRHTSLRLIREFYTFDLMRFSLLPVVAADLRRAADEMLVKRISSITLGERISLARRGSTAVAAALLLDKESHVWQAALENSRLTEVAIVQVLVRSKASPAFVEAVCRHFKWSLRQEIRIALLRNAKTPLVRALEFARTLPPAQLRDILHASHLPEKIKSYLRRELELKPGAKSMKLPR